VKTKGTEATPCGAAPILVVGALLCVATCIAPAVARAQGTREVPRTEFFGELADARAPVDLALLPGADPGIPERRAEFLGARPDSSAAIALAKADDVAVAAPDPDGRMLDPVRHAEFFGELPDDVTSLQLQPLLTRHGVNLFVAAHRTGAQRFSDTVTRSGKPRRRPVATSIRLRLADDRNFTNRTRFLARRLEEANLGVSAEIATVWAGEQLLDTLVAASRRGPITNLVIYGHAAANALFMQEDIGFYADVAEVAKESKHTFGTDEERDTLLRLMGARDLADFEWLLNHGRIRFALNPVIVFAGCGVAGKREIDARSIAARIAEMTGGLVVASVDVTDQSMTRGRNFRNYEYSRRGWVRFVGSATAERLNTHVIDALRQLNLEGESVAAGPAPQPAAVADQN